VLSWAFPKCLPLLLRNASNIYIALQIIVLLLSQDEPLAKAIHKIPIASVPWYKERNLAHTTLGSLAFVALLRAAHKNLLGSRDVYLHSNTLAALANLAPHAAALSAHAAHRLVALLDAGRKRLKWLAGPRVRSCCYPSELLVEFQYNQSRDLAADLLHSNTLAALANLATHAANLRAPRAAHRLVSLLGAGRERLKRLAGPRVRYCWCLPLRACFSVETQAA
jgi:Dyggve-Melchior-Clausen syndrome protein